MRIANAVGRASGLFRSVAMLVAASMALLITCAIIMRALKTPMAGEHELIELMMLSMVMLGLAFVQRDHGHIVIEVVVDRFPPRGQAACDLLAIALTVFAGALIGWANLDMAWEYATESPMSTDFLSLPLYPFKILVGLGFWLWALQALVDLPPALARLRTGERAADASGKSW